MTANDLPDGYRPLPGEDPITLEVGGEVFTLSMRDDGGCDYHWESGPNQGYGFGGGPVRTVGDPDARYLKSMDEHRESIRSFLSDINPETGYLD
ncbi:hypothetical protein ACFWQG_19765 [Rhodococcus sp. NPDC058532]|uniref:hypothetical protein n=1 Tax=Rhodococcus sp. NPDC058532 TaxID=3346540 RepID=UPI00364D62BF